MDKEYLDIYEDKLQDNLLKLASSLGMLGGTLLASDDIDEKWREFAPEFMQEAVKNFNAYPEFTLACSAYCGMAMAKYWDEDWGRNHSRKFETLLGSRGFDNMDDHIVEDVLGKPLDSTEAGVLVKTMECITSSAYSFLRHSDIEAGTASAFHALARTCKVLYRIGEAMELKALGYSYTAIPVAPKYKN